MDEQDKQDRGLQREGLNMDEQDKQDRGLQREGLNMDEQDKQDRVLQHEGITKGVIGCAFEVINELGAGFLESVYEKALVLALRQKGISVVCQHPIQVLFRNENVGDFYADLLVEAKVIVELKAVKTLLPEHQAQIINYLNATGIEVGLLINFGNPKLEYRRFTRSRNPVHPVHPC